MLITDLVAVAATYYVAFLIRFDGSIPQEQLALCRESVLLLVVITLLFFVIFEVYRGIYKYASINDLHTIVKAVTASFITHVISLYLLGFDKLPRSILVIGWLLTILVIGGIRFGARFYHRRFFSLDVERKRVLVVGAGDAGEMMIRQMRNRPDMGYEPVGLVDDNPAKRKATLHGVRVLGTHADIPAIVKSKRVDEIIIATPSATGKEMQQLVAMSKNANVPVKTVPGAREIMDGKVALNQIRELSLEDLLGREPVVVDAEEVGVLIKGKRVLVTGAAGSIGSELCKQLISYGPEMLICFERSENSLYQLDYDLSRLDNNGCVVPLVADVTRRERVAKIFEKYRPHVVFHAAAHKHVPLMESHPDEAVINNVVGTINVVEMAAKYCAERFVMISTDKTVAPTSVMGATKRVAELFVQGFDRTSETACITVRFGNVLGSNGSVVPLFQQQIANGGPVTVTHPEMSRFFMTIPEAAQLITQSAAMGEGGEIFVLDMGEPMKIMDMAHHLITLSGYEPGKDIEIKIVGCRPGEKMYEELWNSWEKPLPTRHEKILSALSNPVPWDSLITSINILTEAAYASDVDGVMEEFHSLIPDYRSEYKLSSTPSSLTKSETELAAAQTSPDKPPSVPVMKQY